MLSIGLFVLALHTCNVCVSTPVKYQERPEEPVCYSIIGNNKCDRVKAEKSDRMTNGCNTSVNLIHVPNLLDKGLFGYECSKCL